MEYVIEAENLTIMYDSVKAVEGLTFKLKKGETLPTFLGYYFDIPPSGLATILLATIYGALALGRKVA